MERHYQLGSLWSHDNGIIALGFNRYDFAAEAARIARGISVDLRFWREDERTCWDASIQAGDINVKQQFWQSWLRVG